MAWVAEVGALGDTVEMRATPAGSRRCAALGRSGEVAARHQRSAHFVEKAGRQHGVEARVDAPVQLRAVAACERDREQGGRAGRLRGAV